MSTIDEQIAGMTDGERQRQEVAGLDQLAKSADPVKRLIASVYRSVSTLLDFHKAHNARLNAIQRRLAALDAIERRATELERRAASAEVRLGVAETRAARP
jgi:predicted acylesterase/phospholipase RssA